VAGSGGFGAFFEEYNVGVVARGAIHFFAVFTLADFPDVGCFGADVALRDEKLWGHDGCGAVRAGERVAGDLESAFEREHGHAGGAGEEDRFLRPTSRGGACRGALWGGRIQCCR
jgi:hypothetical protein